MSTNKLHTTPKNQKAHPVVHEPEPDDAGDHVPLPPCPQTDESHHHLDAHVDDAVDDDHVHYRVHGNDDVDGYRSHGDDAPDTLAPAGSVRTVRHLVLFNRRPAGGGQ